MLARTLARQMLARTLARQMLAGTLALQAESLGVIGSCTASLPFV